MSTFAANIICGKNKVSYTSNYDCGDYLIVINAEKVKLTGNKLETKQYYNHSRYPGGLRTRTAKVMVNSYPVEMVERSITGMIPHTRLGRKQAKKLFVYAGNEHPHSAQEPETITMGQK